MTSCLKPGDLQLPTGNLTLGWSTLLWQEACLFHAAPNNAIVFMSMIVCFESIECYLFFRGKRTYLFIEKKGYGFKCALFSDRYFIKKCRFEI